MPRVTKHIHVPRTHLNGTGKLQLSEAYEAAHDALATAFEVLKQTAPNGRDYYTDPGTLPHAQIEHRNRLLAVSNCQDELSAIVGGIQDGEVLVEAQVME